jgi:hypothetical protein
VQVQRAGRLLRVELQTGLARLWPLGNATSLKKFRRMNSSLPAVSPFQLSQ